MTLDSTVSTTTQIAVRLQPDKRWVTREWPRDALARLERAGLPATRLAPPGAGVVRLELAETGWEEGNLAALVAAARARPGVSVRWGDSLAARARAGEDGLPQPENGAEISLHPHPSPAVAFLDRDGTIMEERPYLADPAGVTLLPGAAAGLRHMAAAGMRLVVLTNQSGVGRGLIAGEQVAAIHARLKDLLTLEDVTVDGIYHCPHAPEAGCTCRKPGDGMVRQAAAELSLDPTRAVVVGDRAADLALARRLGVPGILVTTGYGQETLASAAVQADYVVDDLDEAARICCHPAGVSSQFRVPSSEFPVPSNVQRTAHSERLNSP